MPCNQLIFELKLVDDIQMVSKIKVPIGNKPCILEVNPLLVIRLDMFERKSVFDVLR